MSTHEVTGIFKATMGAGKGLTTRRGCLIDRHHSMRSTSTFPPLRIIGTMDMLHVIETYGLWVVFMCVLLDQGGLPVPRVSADDRDLGARRGHGDLAVADPDGGDRGSRSRGPAVVRGRAAFRGRASQAHVHRSRCRRIPASDGRGVSMAAGDALPDHWRSTSPGSPPLRRRSQVRPAPACAASWSTTRSARRSGPAARSRSAPSFTKPSSPSSSSSSVLGSTR